MPASTRDDAPPRLVTIPREEFLTDHWDYKAGEHVTLLGPTQTGKSTLAFELLEYAAEPELPAVVIVVKRRDKVVEQWTKSLDFELVHDWPPPPTRRIYWGIRRKQPSGYTVWPRFPGDPAKDAEVIRTVHGKVLRDSYKHGDRIVFADETYGLSKEAKLDTELNAIWSRGASAGCGMWAASQRPYNMPLLAYSSAEHVFIARDPDKRDRERYGEIGGIDPKRVDHYSLQLPKYHWLYIRRTGPAMCIVGK